MTSTLSRNILIYTVLFLSMIFVCQADAAPNEMARRLKHGKKIGGETVEFHGQIFELKSNPSTHQPLLIKSKNSEENANSVNTWINKWISENLRGETFSLRSSGDFFQLFLGDKLVEGANIEKSCDELSCIYFLQLPHRLANVWRFNESPDMPLMFTRRGISEYKTLKTQRGTEYFLPLEKEPIKIEKEINTTLHPTAKVFDFQIPSGRFPDQIRYDQMSNSIWMTQPAFNKLLGFEIASSKWIEQAVRGTPDGLRLDSQRRLWFGEYEDGFLGMFDLSSSEYKRIQLPYDKAAPAIPFEDRNHQIWLTDHENNKVLRLNKDESFTELNVPTPRAWPVDLIQPEQHNNIYVTECYSNMIGKIDPETLSYEEITLPTSACPAFFIDAKNHLWITYWSTSLRIASLNLSTKEVVEYVFKLEAPSQNIRPNGGLGPIAKLSNGLLAIGSTTGHTMILFNPETERAEFVEGIGGLKDGIAVDSQDHIWLTLEDNRIQKVEL